LVLVVLNLWEYDEYEEDDEKGIWMAEVLDICPPGTSSRITAQITALVRPHIPLAPQAAELPVEERYLETRKQLVNNGKP
jgi:hypothetical protein